MKDLVTQKLIDMFFQEFSKIFKELYMSVAMQPFSKPFEDL